MRRLCISYSRVARPAGRLYVPSKKQCIAITNQENKVGPYYTTLKTCDTAYHERWVVDTSKSNAIYWVHLTIICSVLAR